VADSTDSASARGNTGTLVGRRLGKYDVVRFVGRGGMGCVYEAINTTIQKRVALKCIDHALQLSADAKARFEREALAASAADSPYIVQIFDAGSTDDGLPYLVMELLRGEDLGSHLEGVGRLELGDAIAVTAQILKGLHHAHAAGVVHRDLKPDNVFLTARDDEPAAVKLLDFGVSKVARKSEVPLETLTREGTVVGTPYYMSPEQAQSFPDVDARADLYSCAAILYECLCGRPPHVGQSYEQVIVNICMKNAEDVRAHNPAVPEAVAAWLKKGLGREREQRYQSAREMLDALSSAAPESIKARGPMKIALAASSGRKLTPRRVSDPSELADTVRISSTPPVGDSGERPVARASTGNTLRSFDGSSARRVRVMAAMGAGALVVAIALYVGTRGSSDATSTATATSMATSTATASATSTASATATSIATSTSTTSATSTASATSTSTVPSASADAKKPVPVVARPVGSVRPVESARTNTPPPPVGPLEILPR
jgi:eukaryotic-like serine/threonine-protein kinase